MPYLLDTQAQAQVFLDAHGTHSLSDSPVGEQTLRAVYDLCKWGPTAMSNQPMRFVLVRSAEGKAKLAQALSPGNVDKTLAAPATAIGALGPHFHTIVPTQRWAA
jgi:nitroreductase